MPSTPASRSTIASVRDSSMEVTGAPPGAIPMWQWASTRPGRMNPPLTTVVSALPSSSTRSSTVSDGRKTPRRCTATNARSHTSAGGHMPGRRLLVLVSLVHELAEVEVGRLERVGVQAGRQLWHRTTGKRHAWPAPAGGLALALVLGRLRRLAPHAGQAHHAAHLLHHLLGVLEAVEQLVDVHHGHTRATGDAGAARSVDDLGVGPLLWGHRPDDRRDPVEVLVVELCQLVLHLAHARHHPEHVGDRAHPAHGDQLV